MIAEEVNYYDVLEITPDASVEEIREAYLRIKTTYQKDHVALYTLFSTSEREEILKMAEEAYVVLSDRDKRRNYDKKHGLVVWEENPFKRNDPAPQEGVHGSDAEETPLAEIISIDRTPPMDDTQPNEDLLVSPSTDFTVTEPVAFSKEYKTRSTWSQDQDQRRRIGEPSGRPPSDSPYVARKVGQSSSFLYSTELMIEIQNEKEWSGQFLKRIRESIGMSIEEISESTKVSKNYIQAIEEETFQKLPAPVYVRGFVIQIARTLKLPGNEVATAYISRYRRKLAG